MGSSNVLGLIIEIDNTGANQSIRSVNASLSNMERQSIKSAKGMAGGMDEMSFEMYKARGAAMMLENQIGVRLPRSINTFLAKSATIGPALMAGFEIAAIVAVGMAIFKAGQQLYAWATDTKEQTERLKELTKQAKEATDQFDKYAESMRKLADASALIGLSGQAKEARLIGSNLSSQVMAKMDLDALSAKYNQLYMLAADRGKSGEERLAASAQLTKEGGIQDQKIKAEQELNKLIAEGKNLQDEIYAANIKDFEQRKNAVAMELFEGDKRAEKLTLVKMEHQYTSMMNAQQWDQARALAEQIRIEKQRVALKNWLFEASQKQWELDLNEATRQRQLETDFERAVQEALDKEWQDFDKDFAARELKMVEFADSMTKSNAAMAAQIAKEGQINFFGRNVKDFASEQKIKLAEVDREMAPYLTGEQTPGTLEAIAAFEQKKKLIIQQSNLDIAVDTKSRFEETARNIEGFLDRVFVSARSFADIWKQLWMQSINYVVKQFARMAAAWWMTRQGMAAAPAGGGGSGGGGIGGFLGGILNSGGGGGGGGGKNLLGGFVNGGYAVPGAGGGSGGSGGGGGIGGLGGLLNLGGLKNFIGMGKGASNAATGVYGAGTGSGFSLGGLMKSDAAAMGGALLAGYGLKRGGLVGLGMTTAGGAMIGFRYGGPVGAVIGAAIGFTAGMIRLFIKGALEKCREKVKACYGVDIKDKGVLQQIVDMAKQGFGGNLDMAIRSQQVRDLVELYAMTTGQKPSGMPAKMTSSTLVQSGGSLFQQPGYSNGSPMPTFGGLPGAGINSLGASNAAPINVTINLSPEAAQNLLTQGVLKIMGDKPRVVQGATMAATKQNSGRRELTALQLSPGTLTS